MRFLLILLVAGGAIALLRPLFNGVLTPDAERYSPAVDIINQGSASSLGRSLSESKAVGGRQPFTDLVLASADSLTGDSSEKVVLIGDKVDPDDPNMRLLRGSSQIIEIGLKVNPDNSAMLAIKGSSEVIQIGERVELDAVFSNAKSGNERPVSIGRVVQPGNLTSRRELSSRRAIEVGQRRDVEAH